MRVGSLFEVDASPEATLMSRYSIGLIRETRGDEAAALFRETLLEWLKVNTVEGWSQSWLRNRGTFLQSHAWDQDHDFGEGLRVQGAMGVGPGCANGGAPATRGLTNAARVREAGFDLAATACGREAAVVGCWAGYEALLLRAMGATRVDGVEEVGEYAAWARRLLHLFGVPGAVHDLSLYRLGPAWFEANQFDLVYCPGVLYHCEAPVVALVVLRLMLRVGGTLVLEVMGGNPEVDGVRYLGPSVVGWNWVDCGGLTWLRMLRDAGFEGAEQLDFVQNRATFAARASAQVPLVSSGAAGFSRPDLVEQLRSRVH